MRLGVRDAYRLPILFPRIPHAVRHHFNNLGLGLVVVGLLPQTASLRDGLKLVSIWLLVLLAGATVSQLIARTTRQGDTTR